MHQNYHYSAVQNARNIVDLEKIGLEITMKTPNFNLYRFKKVYVFISNQANTPSISHKNQRLTGEWLIVDISYKFDNGKFTQIVRLVTRELNLAPNER